MLMVINIKDNGIRVLSKDKEYTLGLMVLLVKAIGKWASNMDRPNTSTLISHTLAITNKATKLAMGYNTILMEICIYSSLYHYYYIYIYIIYNYYYNYPYYLHFLVNVD